MMKSVNYYIKISVVGILLLFSCKKKPVVDIPPGNDPVFDFKGTFGSEPFELAAGVENCYLSSFTDYYNNVKRFNGKLSDGKTEVEVSLFNGSLDLMVPEFPLNPSQIRGASLSTERLIRFTKNQFSNSSAVDHVRWYCNSKFIGLDSAFIFEPGIYDVRADVTFLDGTFGQVNNSVIVGFKRHGSFKLNHILKSNNFVKFFVSEVSGEIKSYQWKLDGAIVSEQPSFEIEWKESAQKVSCRVEFANGAVKENTVFIGAGDAAEYIDDFSVFERQQNPDNFWDNKMLVVIRKGGNEYRSDFAGNQTLNGTIEKVDYYGTNTAGNKVFKFKATISGKLKNTSTNELVPIEFKTNFGVEIK